LSLDPPLYLRHPVEDIHIDAPLSMRYQLRDIQTAVDRIRKMKPKRSSGKRILRILLIVTVITTLFYSMTALVYREGDFAGALVLKPYPMYPVIFGGGEEGHWARRHPGQPPPWFMQQDLKIISRFDWEQGRPNWVEAYGWGALANLLAWLVLAFTAAIKLIKALFERSTSRNRITTLGVGNVSREA
jgi:hypothetical protein